MQYNTLPCVKKFRGEAIRALLFVTIITQLIDISGLVCCWTLFSSRRISLHKGQNGVDLSKQLSFSGHRPSDEGLDLDDAHKKWSSRCKFLCKSVQCCTCNLIGGMGVEDEGLEAGSISSILDYIDLLSGKNTICFLSP